MFTCCEESGKLTLQQAQGKSLDDLPCACCSISSDPDADESPLRILMLMRHHSGSGAP